MLEIGDMDMCYFGSVFAHAISLGPGPVENLLHRLMYLDHYGCPPPELTDEHRYYTKCVLLKDMDAYSFYFTIFQAVTKGGDPLVKRLVKQEDGSVLYKDEPMLNGGLIFHPGSGVPGISDGTHSVELCSSSEPHWTIHT